MSSKNNLLLKKELEITKKEKEQALKLAAEMELKYNELLNKLNSISPAIVEFSNNPSLYEWAKRKFWNKYTIVYSIIILYIKRITFWIMNKLDLIPDKYLDNIFKWITNNCQHWINFNYLKLFFQLLVILFIANCVLPLSKLNKSLRKCFLKTNNSESSSFNDKKNTSEKTNLSFTS